MKCMAGRIRPPPGLCCERPDAAEGEGEAAGFEEIFHVDSSHSPAQSSDDIFPLPCVTGESFGSGRGRAARQRDSKFKHELKDVNDALCALNWCAGYSEWGSPSKSLHVASLRSEIAARATALARDQPVDSDALSDEPSFRSMLKGRAPGYEGDSTNVNLAPYHKKMLSLPEDISGAKKLETITSDTALRYLEGYSERMLLSVDEYL